MSELKRQVLGRGLSALLDPTSSNEDTREDITPNSLPVETLIPGKNQPRYSFPEEDLDSLSFSIQEKGILQPILVRRLLDQNEKYEIVAGERRWRAAKKAGLSEVPVIMKDFTDREALEVGLLENIQRQDLNPIEEAEGYRRLAEEFNHTQESLSRTLGKSRSHIANTLRLLTLPKKIRDYLTEGKLSSGHGRALVNADDPEKLADLILEQGLNVRQTEGLRKSSEARGVSLGSRGSDPEREILCQHISELLGIPTDLTIKGKGGKIIIPFNDPTELDQILQKFNQIKGD
ncbi:ParB/RepB/Spo0J family partition protein [Geitlerinema splendidum]|jgi:ParB family chromosome partitioning protein|nr:ParB/RepB/Spo0J family partition protein [Geitlerinema splendidum]